VGSCSQTFDHGGAQQIGSSANRISRGITQILLPLCSNHRIFLFEQLLVGDGLRL
jgi:hypothetical protein